MCPKRYVLFLHFTFLLNGFHLKNGLSSKLSTTVVKKSIPSFSGSQPFILYPQIKLWNFSYKSFVVYVAVITHFLSTNVQVTHRET